MSKLLSVKEVCQLTGLNRKLLYLYKDVVKPSGYKNVGYEKKNGEWCDGHKQYDEKDIIKLQQISIFEKLRIDREKIKEKMSAVNYDSNKILDEQIALLKMKKNEIEELIEAAELMKQSGIQGEVSGFYAQCDINALAKRLLGLENKIYYKELCNKAGAVSVEEMAGHADIMRELVLSAEGDVEGRVTKECVKQLKTILVEHYGAIGWVILVAIAVSGEGEGEFIKDYISFDFEDESKEKIISHAISGYLAEDIWVLFEKIDEILMEYTDIIGIDFTNGDVKKMVSLLCELFREHFGIRSKAEFQLFFDMVQDVVIQLDEKDIKYAFDALKFYCS